MTRWTPKTAAAIGEADMEQLLDNKLLQAAAAKELAQSLEHEYDEMLKAAVGSGWHPRAALRKSIGEELHRVLDYPTMMQRSEMKPE